MEISPNSKIEYIFIFFLISYGRYGRVNQSSFGMILRMNFLLSVSPEKVKG